MRSAEISFPIFGEGFVINIPSHISVFGFSLYLYGFFVTAGFILAGLYLLKRHKMLGLERDNVLDMIIIAVPCGLIGARIFYIIFEFESYFGSGNWRSIFMIREGGLAVYGGIILSGVAFVLYSRFKKIHIGKLLDAAGFGLFIGQAVGRWGNFFNREAFGVETDVPWRMGLNFQRTTYIESLDRTFTAGTHYFHPAFLYESLWNIAGLVMMHIFSVKFKTKYYGQYFLFYVAWYGLGRFIIEGLRVDSLYIHGTSIRVSQLLAAFSCIAAAAILIRNHKKGVGIGDGAPEEAISKDSEASTSEPEASESESEASTSELEAFVAEKKSPSVEKETPVSDKESPVSENESPASDWESLFSEWETPDTEKEKDD